MGESSIVDEEAMEACLKDITKALLGVRASLGRPAPRLPAQQTERNGAPSLAPSQADVNVGLVVQMKKALHRPRPQPRAAPCPGRELSVRVGRHRTWLRR